jgi:putative ABC transport system permease protein
LFVGHWGVSSLKALIGVDLPSWVTIELDRSVLLFTIGVTLLAGLLASVAPALAAGRAHVGASLREVARGGAGGVSERRMRSVLVVAELGLALALLAGAGLLVRSFERLRSGDLGFRPERMLTFRVALPWSTYPSDGERIENFLTETLRKLRELPGVEAATFNGGLPIIASREGYRTSFTAEGQPEVEQRENPFVFLQEIHPGYFDVMGIPLVEGRAFSDLDRKETEPVAIINRHFAETFWPGEIALGKRVKLGSPGEDRPYHTIVGVVGDVKHESLAGSRALDFYTSYLQTPYANAYFLLRTGVDPLSLVEPARRVVLSVDPDQSIYDVFTMEERLLSSVWQRRLASVFFALFAGLALLLAAIGIYGVTSYAVQRRRREMGVRSALGAGPRDIVVLLLSDGMKLSLWGAAVGLAGALFLSRLLRSLLHEVSPSDPATFLAVTVLLVSVAVLSTYVPALRARRVEPVDALRQE